MSRAVEDAICGAVGEVTALVAMYPVDTVKVQCQAHSTSAAHVLQELFRLGPAVACRKLYAGVGSAAIVAAAMGSLYLFAFYSVKRMGGSVVCMAESASRRNTEMSTEVFNPSRMVGDECARGNPWIASAAAGLMASMMASLVEAPMEQFKIRTQAGTQRGPIFKNMTSAVSRQGSSVLYAALLPFLLKSIPHDIAELLTFSQLQDVRSQSTDTDTGITMTPYKSTMNDASSHGVSKFTSKKKSLYSQCILHLFDQLPESVGDMVTGAIAGGTAAIVAMPFDTTFTRMNIVPLATTTPSSPGVIQGSLNSARIFFATGHKMVEAGGVRSLFVGLGPRLLQAIPASVVFWMAVEGSRRLLEKHYELENTYGDDGAERSRNIKEVHSTPGHCGAMA